MKRFTKKTNNNCLWKYKIRTDKDFLVSQDGRFVEFYGGFINKLAEFEDAEENGLLMRFPCKIGERYFAIFGDDIRELEVKRIEIRKEMTLFNGMTIFLEPVYKRGTFYKVREHEFGDFLFKTKEDAEKALKESRSK